MLWLWGMTAIANAGCPTAFDLGWMTGLWRHVDGAHQIEELWSAPGGGTLIGHGRTIHNGATAFFEHLMVRPSAADCPEYVAWPAGASPTVFAYVRHHGTEVVFEAPEHDWPQRITYRRSGDTLVATATDFTASKTVTTTLQLVP
jgi:hypothetical protein